MGARRSFGSFLARRRLWVALGALALVVIIGVLTRKRGAAADAGKSLAATVKRTDLEVVVLETGRIDPRLQTQVKSKVGGQVVEVTVQEGQKVKRGQALLRIDPTDYRRDVARMDAETAEQHEMLVFARLQLDRAERARAASVVPMAELDQARHEAALGEARLRASQVALDTAKDRLRYTQIDAPFDGTIIQRNIQPGEVVVPGMTATVEGKPLLVLADLSVLVVKTDLNQIDVARVRNGQRAEVTLDSLPGKKFTATVTRVAAAATTVNTRDVFTVESSLDNSQDLTEIKPGMTADIRILIEVRPKVLVLPIEAVTHDKGSNFVQVSEQGADGKSHHQSREVKLGARNDREVEITSGLSEGTVVNVQPPSPKEANL